MDAAKLNHRLLMDSRKKVEVTGVLDLLVFDETEVIMETSEGMLSIRGTDLHMSSLNLDQGQVGLAGEVSEIVYDEVVNSKNKSGLMSRLFRS
ncbi:MAG: sporulation protein YabP [Lachnospiraceae bacterium]|jgi:sporulation protein YabP|nr:sporulation protein YabP [Lachnospiraceae bacterium]